MKLSMIAVPLLAALTLAPNLSAAVCADINNCTFDLNLSNNGQNGLPNFSGGFYGTVNLVTSLNAITLVNDIIVTIDLADGYKLVNTGFPNGSGTDYGFGFNQTVTGPFTYGPYSPVTPYSGGAAGTFQFDGFGNFENAVATDSLQPGDAGNLNVLSFAVKRSGGFSDVNSLVELSSIPPGEFKSYFVADVIGACGSAQSPGTCTGLVGTNSVVPEPTSYLAMLIAGFGAVFVVNRRRRNRLTAEYLS